MDDNDGVTKVKLHKQDPERAGLVTASDPDNSIAATEKKEDPDELGSEDFKEAADKAQVDVCVDCKTVSLGPTNFQILNYNMRKLTFQFAVDGHLTCPAGSAECSGCNSTGRCGQFVRLNSRDPGSQSRGETGSRGQGFPVHPAHRGGLVDATFGKRHCCSSASVPLP